MLLAMIGLTAVILANILLMSKFTQPYTIDIVNKNITPDPTTLADKDVNFIGMVSLKASCILDDSTRIERLEALELLWSC